MFGIAFDWNAGEETCGSLKPAGPTRALDWGSAGTEVKHKWLKMRYDLNDSTYIFTKRWVGYWMEKE